MEDNNPENPAKTKPKKSGINLDADNRFKEAPKHLLPLLNIRENFFNFFTEKKK